MNDNPIVYSATLSTITKTYNASLAVSSRIYSANVATVINATIIDVPKYEGSYVAIHGHGYSSNNSTGQLYKGPNN